MLSKSTAPIYYDDMNIANSIYQPSMLHCQNTGLQRFYRKYLLEKAFSVYKWEGIPENWSLSYFLYCLYCWGYVAVVNTDKYGIIPQGCSVSGYTIYYEPNEVLIANPKFKTTYRLTIGENCEIIRLQNNWSGLLDLINFYADMMALNAESAATNLMNSKLAYVFTAKDKTTAESFKKLYDKIASGEPAVFQDKNLLDDNGNLNWQTFTQNLSQNYIAGSILEDMKKWEQKFLTDIGVPNANTDKKERLISDEVNSNNVEIKCLADVMLDTLKASCKRVNKMFGLNISVDYRFKEEAPEMGAMEVEYEK